MTVNDRENRIELKGTKLLVFTALVFATAIVLAAIENALPPVVAILPGIKLGLSNIAVMYALFFLGKPQAYTIAVLKSVFVLLTRGAVAGILSLTGGVLSITVMVLLVLIFRKKISYLILSIAGAIFHNLGQLVAVSMVMASIYIWAYLPVLIASGVVAGIATAALLRAIMPALKKLGTRGN